MAVTGGTDRVRPARLAAPDAVRPLPHRLPPPWPGRTEEIDGSTLYVRETPPTADGAEPALYVHGLGGSSQNWTDLAYLLSDRLAGQAIDLPGFGRSGAPSHGRYTQQAFADTVARWIERSGRGPVHLLGNSLGGAITLRVAALRPELIRTLTLVSPAMPVRRPGVAHRRMVPVILLPGVEPLVRQVLSQMTAEQIAGGVLDVCFADPSRVPEQRRQEAVAEASFRLGVTWAATAYVGALKGLASSYLAPGGRSLWRLAERVTAPTLVIWGRQDKLVSPRLAARTARAIPDSRLLVLGGIGHTAQMEVPHLVARAVVGLVDERVPRAVG